MLLSFRHEISRMAYLRHPNVVAFYGVIWRPPALAIVTELAVGQAASVCGLQLLVYDAASY
jgi:hypothetical protein